MKVFFSKTKFLLNFDERAKTNLSKTEMGEGGGSRPFSTIVFKKVTKQNKENLSDTKIFYVTKGCLKNLARAKSALRARNLKKSIFGATDFDPPQVPSHIIIE